MVITRKTPSGRATVTLDDSFDLDLVSDKAKKDKTDIADRVSVSFLPGQIFLHINWLDTVRFYTTWLGQQYHKPIPI
jgi:hypothetical protein